MMQKPAGFAGFLLMLLCASNTQAQFSFTETAPKGTFVIDSSFIMATVSGAWDNDKNLGPIIQPDQRYEPTTGELLGTLAPQVEAKTQIWVNVISYGILDSLTAVVGIPVVVKSSVRPNFEWTPGDVIAQYGRRFDDVRDFWDFAWTFRQPEVTDWDGNYFVLSDIILGGRYRFTDLFPWFERNRLAGAMTLYGAIPTGSPPDPEEVVSMGTTTWSLHFQGELGIHVAADYTIPGLDDRLTFGVDSFHEAFFERRYDTPTGVIHKILLIGEDELVGDTYTINPGNFYGVAGQIELVPWRGPTPDTWLSRRVGDQVERFPPLLSLYFRYTHTRFGQTKWEGSGSWHAAWWEYKDKEEIWQPGYKNILTGMAQVSLLRLGVPMMVYAGYRNQTWIPGKNFRAANVINVGFRVPLAKFW